MTRATLTFAAMLAIALSSVALPSAWAGGVITDDFNGSYDIYWNWIADGTSSKSFVNNQLSITSGYPAALGGDGSTNVGAIAIDTGTYTPYVYADAFVSMGMNLDTAKANNDQGLIARVQTNTTFYGLNYDPYLKGIGLIYYNGTTFQDLAAAEASTTEQAVTLKLQALNSGSYVHLVGQAWSVGETPSLLGEIQFRVGVDTPKDEGETPILSAGGVGFYTAMNENDPLLLPSPPFPPNTYAPATIDALLDNFLARDGLAGDVNLDGEVDSADYTLWADNYDTGSLWSLGDLNLDGSVDSADYTVWADNYGNSALGGSSDSMSSMSSFGSPIPEPSTMVLLGMAIVAFSSLAFIRRRRKAA